MVALTLLIIVVFVFWLFAKILRTSSTMVGDTPKPDAQATPPIVRHAMPSRASVSDSTTSSGESLKCWFPPGRGVDIAGYHISDGMIYVGSEMKSLRGYSGGDPALINPSLPVSARSRDPKGDDFQYWPSYSRISESSRASYLEWLASGRKDPGIGIGYVFLFFYGIERRLLHDASRIDSAKNDVPTLVGEVERLLEIYGHNDSFRGYAANLLDILGFREKGLDVMGEEPPEEWGGWDIPARVKVGLGSLVSEGKPIPPGWALAWLLRNPYSQVRIPAQRCPQEFRKLFHLRYGQKYGEGLKLAPNKKRLKITYLPASATFPGAISIQVRDLPDVTVLKSPVERLQRIADQVCDELDPYSRRLGRNGGKRDIVAVGLLPPEIAPDSADVLPFFRSIQQRIDAQGWAPVPAEEFIKAIGSNSDEMLTKKEASQLLQALELMGLGVEPDVRHGGVNLSKVEKVVVFKSSGRVTQEEMYVQATLLLHLSVAVAAADDHLAPDEQQHLERHIENALDLEQSARLRLQAHLRWLLECPPKMSGLKGRIKTIPANERRGLARFLIMVAGADGQVGPEEIRTLAKIYPLLGFDRNDVYGDIHALATGPLADQGPVTITGPELSIGYAIPTLNPTGVIELDATKVAAIKEETRRVASVLGEIFSAGDEEPAPETPSGDEVQKTLIPGLDESHSALVCDLRMVERWSKADFAKLTERHGLLPAGATETINEAAFELAGELLLDGEDPLEVNLHVLEEMI